MGRRLIMLLTAGVLMLGLPAFAQPTVAAPAEPYSETGCDRIVADGVAYDLCYFVRENIVGNESASGNTLFTLNGVLHFTVTLASDGSMFSQQSQRYHVKNIVVKGNEQVSHTLFRGEFILEGQTCPYAFNFVYANGEARHEFDLNTEECA